MLEALRDMNVLFSRLSLFLSYFTRVEFSFHKHFHVFLFLICWISIIWDLDCIVPMVHFQCIWVYFVFNAIFVTYQKKKYSILQFKVAKYLNHLPKSVVFEKNLKQ